MEKFLIVIATILIFLLAALGVWKLADLLLLKSLNTDYDRASMRWSILGAMGSWAGSIFGAIALVISILALW